MLQHAHHHIAAALRNLGSLLPDRARRRRPANQLTQPWRNDHDHSHPSVGITPSRLLAYLHAADAGAPNQQFELFSEMLKKWPRLRSVEATRRFALTGLDWEIATHDNSTHPNANSAASFCRQTLDQLPRFREALNHLASAIGFGIAVAELVWDRGQLVDIVPVPHSRLITDHNQPWRLRIRTADEPTSGIPLDDSPHKWIIHQPNPTPGRHFEGGLLRASTLLYLAQNLSFKDWLIFSQIAGMPVRVAQFEPGTSSADRNQLLQMLQKLGTDAVAVLGKNIDLKFVEPARGGARPYEPLQDYCNTEITILWLGQHLTTDLRNSGSRAAAEVHDRVREDLLTHDVADESQTIRRDLLTPLVQARFGPDVPIPLFRRSLVQAVDTKTLASTLAIAVNQLGLRVPRRWVHQALGVPEPQIDEPVLSNENPQ